MSNPTELLQAKAAAKALGYEEAGCDDIWGRCLADCTVFVEFDERSGCVRSWMVDAGDHRCAGDAYDIHGSWLAAFERAHELLMSQYAEERLSGNLPRQVEAPRVSVSA